MGNTTAEHEAILVFNRLLSIADKNTNLAIWAKSSWLDEPVPAQKAMRYYLTHLGEARRINKVQAKQPKPVEKLCVLFPGFNGGPFDLFHLAEMLVEQGYWVVSAGCHIDPSLKPTDDPDKIAAALESTYPRYDNILSSFAELTGMSIEASHLDHILYGSFSAGIFPLMRAMLEESAPEIDHRLILMAPGLSKSQIAHQLPSSFPLRDVLLVHSKQDTHPTYGDPQDYQYRFHTTPVTVHLLEQGGHYDFVHLPATASQTGAQTTGSASSNLKHQCHQLIHQFIQEDSQ